MTTIVVFDARGTTLQHDKGEFLPGVLEMLQKLQEAGFETALWTGGLPDNTDEQTVARPFTKGFLGAKSGIILRTLFKQYQRVILVDDMPNSLGYVLWGGPVEVFHARWSGRSNSHFNRFYEHLGIPHQ